MDRQLIWAVKSKLERNTSKKLSALAARDDLFDISTVDTKSKEYDWAVSNFEMARKMGCSVVTYIDDAYPEVLRTIPQPPPILYVMGNAGVLKDTVFAGLVGSRKCDDYGIRMAESIAMEIGQTGAGIVSGGALGVDAASHRGALRAKAPTVAVLGSGMDIAYPKENHPLFNSIAKSGGAVITEFPFGEVANGWNFPRRNRVIAALSTAVVVVRAAYRSGSLITATRAMEMNTTVFAVPGNIDNVLSAGTNELIRDGALPLLSPMDVIDELVARRPDYFVREKDKKEERAKEEFFAPTPAKEEKKEVPSGLSEYENEIVNIINDGFNTQPQIEEKVSFEAGRLGALLAMMEIKGI
ncbi:MAG: DNA-processing protein DprA, partial [Clostridia bacterium]|nr:DNA-processing protein DprA [Clostridia bacterium]